MLPQSSFTIKPKHTFVFVFFLFFILLIVLIGSKVGYKNPTLYYYFGGVTIFVMLWLAVLSKTKIYIDNDVIRMETIVRKQQLFWKEIAASRLTWQPEGAHGLSLSWIFQPFNGREMEIRLGFYSRKDLAILSQQLIERAKHAVIAEKIHNMAKGQFPWYIW
jgi:hypothetical protein